MHPAIPISMVFFGCCLNVVFLELLVGGYQHSGNIITFSQFLFIAAEGFICTSKFGSVKSKIPISLYGYMVCFFFVVQVLNNYVFIFDIPMTLHIIFRAGSLIASLSLGVIIQKRRYPWHKYASVIIITVGIILCTIASATNHKKAVVSDVHKEDELDEDEPVKSFDMFNWVFGIGGLLASLFLTARLGIFQETTYRQYGKHPKESLFYNHALPLPGFLLVSFDIYHAAIAFNQSEPVWLLGLMIPKMWLFLLGNVVTQYICIRAVFILTTECTALTVTLVVTLRKFVSLILSIVYFSNPFTFWHWMGALCVFGGTLMFTEVIPVSKMFVPPKKKE